MKIKLVEGMFLVQSGITVNEMETAMIYAPEALVVTDENNDQLYCVAPHVNRTAKINKFSFTANALTSGKELMFAIAANVDPTVSADEAKKQLQIQFGQSLAAAAKYLPIVKQQISDAYAPIAEVMGSVQDTSDPTEEA